MSQKQDKRRRRQQKEMAAAVARNLQPTPAPEPDVPGLYPIAKPSGQQPPGAQIQLCNPVADHFGPFIFGNAEAWQERAMADLAASLPAEQLAALQQEYEHFKPPWVFAQGKLFHDAIDAIGTARYVVEEGSAAGQHLILCGAGPSLTEHAEEYCRAGDQLWGCNSALPWLVEHGYPVTHGVTVDQTADMCKEWLSAPNVEYLIASSVHPHLTEYLTKVQQRRVRYFHNFVGVKRRPVGWQDEHGKMQVMAYEDWMYCTLFPGTVRCGSGLNTVTRAIDVAMYMGFAKITVLGADCCIRVKSQPPKLPANDPEYQRWLREDTIMHADGGNAIRSGATALTLGATIDADTPDETIAGNGRYWETKTDLIISALWLLQMERKRAGQIELIGDTLPAALRNKTEAFLARLPTLVDSGGKALQIAFE